MLSFTNTSQNFSHLFSIYFGSFLNSTFKLFFNPLTPGAFCQKPMFGHFQAGYGPNYPQSIQIAVETGQHAFLSTSIVFHDILPRAYAEIKEKVVYIYKLFVFVHFFPTFLFDLLQ